jgi:hypothetical protein
MRTLLFLVTLTAASVVGAQPVVQVGRYRLQSNPWVNLHQRLLEEARFGAPLPPSLQGEQLSAWQQALDAYRPFIGKRNPLFDAELIAMNAALSATTGWKLPRSIPKPASDVLTALMPAYRATLWADDDRANRFWISLAEPMLVSAAEELAAAHAKAYGVPFPTRILVDVSAAAGQFGAYTVGAGEAAHAVISPMDPANQGLSALETLVHEPSHSIVDTNSGAIGGDISRVSRELGVKPRYNLWHALLFYTAGELTRQALLRRGITEYRPMITLMYERQFRGMKEALEKHWQAYLDGKVSREDAVRQILLETSAGSP